MSTTTASNNNTATAIPAARTTPAIANSAKMDKPPSDSKPSETTPRRLEVKTKEKSRTSSRDSSKCASPTMTEEKRLPPIKAPVGLAKGPDLKSVKSKIGSLNNVKHKPAGGSRKVVTQKLEWNAKPRIGSLENSKYKPGGGEVKVQKQKLEWKAESRVKSLENVKHKPGGGGVKIFDEKYAKGAVDPSSSTHVSSPSPTSQTPKPEEPSTPVKNEPPQAPNVGSLSEGQSRPSSKVEVVAESPKEFTNNGAGKMIEGNKIEGAAEPTKLNGATPPPKASSHNGSLETKIELDSAVKSNEQKSNGVPLASHQAAQTPASSVEVLKSPEATESNKATPQQATVY